MRVAAAFLAGMSLLVPFAARADDAKQGEELSRRWCAACHLVAAGQAPAPTAAPPFAAIAKRPGFDVRQLALSLLAPHPQMPERGLSRDEAAAIAAYILSLR